MHFKSVDDALDFAIAREKEAAEFYTDLADRMDNPQTKQIFLGFAGEERGHQAKLEAIKVGGKMKPAEKSIQTLNIAEYTVDVEINETLTYQDALIIAMKKEKAAFKLYSDLAATAGNPGLTDIFLLLAQEEAKHKLRFEIEYDEFILTNN